ncbi:hypothetical protein N7455_003095 [Penicillium solitum]|uniref:uncharacterized protein n=1 Tax=Penicillium solitum TaxID=60172 RepID=UPI0032C476DE|nr:hypothetical protein N7455_003095 [Penicillium solitum]
MFPLGFLYPGEANRPPRPKHTNGKAQDFSPIDEILCHTNFDRYHYCVTQLYAFTSTTKRESWWMVRPSARSRAKLEENTACDHCQREVVKFVSCVMMPGENHCCNCHHREQKIRCSFGKQCEKRKEDEEKLELDDIEILKRAGTILQNSIGTSKDPRKVKKTKAAMKCLKQHRKELKNHRRTVK